MSHQPPLGKDATLAHNTKPEDGSQKNPLLAERYSPLEWKAIEPPSSWNRLVMRMMILLGVSAIGNFIYWFGASEHAGYPPLYWMLNVALLYFLSRVLFEWYHYWDMRAPKAGEITKDWKVDMFTTACPGEPLDMIERTLRAMVAVKYPHTTYLCDEGDDPYLKQLCEELGVVHVTRTEKVGAKAGNINNALKQASGEICVILDPDHIPVPEFLHRTLPYFDDPEVGYVQCIQAYYNRNESFVAKGAAEQTYHFYGPLMMGMHTYNTAQAIGANCTFRRAALDSIGGHATGTTEDMHTSMHIHSKKWKSYYIPELLTRGLVPATLSGYYKQQLKWARGSFNLLFRVYPKLFKDFSWRQRLHYLLVPLFYLSGVVGLINILIPILSLCMARVPWHMEINDFLITLLPVFLCALLIRQYAQKWLLEEHERGFHIMGGLLQAGTWWIYLVGFVYTLIGKKVPYIPTPKGDEMQDHWLLSVPNVVAMVASLAAIMYGLAIDWSPYSFAMAGFAGVNVLVLGTIVLTSFQRSLSKFYFNLYEGTLARYRVVWYKLRHQYLYEYTWRAKVTVPLLIGFLLFGLVFQDMMAEWRYRSMKDEPLTIPDEYYLMTGPTAEASGKLGHAGPNGDFLKTRWVAPKERQLKPLTLAWDSASVAPWVRENIEEQLKAGDLPFLQWEPWSFIEKTYVKKGEKGEQFFLDLVDGRFDAYLESLTRVLEKQDQPVFINFASMPDHPARMNELNGSLHAYDYQMAWYYLIDFTKDRGITDIAWVYQPYQLDCAWDYYTPLKIDWLALSPTEEGGNDPYEDVEAFREWVDPFLEFAERDEMMMMLMDVHSEGEVHDRPWLHEAIAERPRIRGIHFRDVNTPSTTDVWSSWVQKKLQGTYEMNKALVERWARKQAVEASPFPERGYLKKTSDGFELIVDGDPFYIKGVAYNPEHDWRDGEVPLSWRQLHEDFQMIREMGANTIRRYGRGVYDHNIFQAASEEELKVLYGFYFDPKVDYLKDRAQRQAYKEEILELVERYKDEPALLGWGLSNETWGMLKHHFPQPYLSHVRAAYVDLVEEIAQEIHRKDPDHFVMAALEYGDNELKGALNQFHQQAPSVDVIGINSYYEERLATIHEAVKTFLPNRPYLISEFGPNGYWEAYLNEYDQQGRLREQSSIEKARKYVHDWNEHVLAQKGDNLGGIAYCWRDRMEGSITWYGITDWKGRTKPTYYALKGAWTGEGVSLPLFDVFVERQGVSGQDYFGFIDDPEGKSLKWEWRYLKEGILGEMSVQYTSEDAQFVKISVPDDVENCRLFLFVSDEKGNVVTASKAIN